MVRSSRAAAEYELVDLLMKRLATEEFQGLLSRYIRNAGLTAAGKAVNVSAPKAGFDKAFQPNGALRSFGNF
jgi:hypothetical protein